MNSRSTIRRIALGTVIALSVFVSATAVAGMQQTTIARGFCAGALGAGRLTANFHPGTSVNDLS